MGCKALDKAKAKKHKKGLWSPDEDHKLKNYIIRHGHGCWSSVPVNAGLERNGKSCRLRWINYLRPGLKRGTFSLQEEDKILSLHQILGNKWSQIANHLSGRTDNEIKNYWHSYLKKRVLAKVVETESQGKIDECSSAQSEPSPDSSLASTTSQVSSFESFENINSSLVNTDQSIKEIGASKCNLPKVLFAEWFNIDEFQSQDLGQSVNGPAFMSSSSNFEEASSHSSLINEETFGFDSDVKSSMVSVDNNMLESSFKLEEQVSESGLFDYFPDVFNITYDDMCLYGGWKL